jgi:hypothetical protein
MTASTGSVRFAPDGTGQVDASLRLTPASMIHCHAYPDRPAILSLTDKCVSVTVTIPDSDQVTADDLDTARRLADAVARYITDLESRLAPADESAAAAA